MSDDNTPQNDVSTESQLDFDDLDAFSSSFFGENKTADEPAKAAAEEEIEEAVDDETVDVEEGEDVTESDDDADQDDEDSDDEEEKPQKPEKKQSRFQERINELTEARRQAERREADLLDRLKALEAQKEGSTPAPSKTVSTNEAPTPADTNEDGTDKYPLGEFDPNFIRDLTKHTIKEAQAEADAERQKTDSQREAEKNAQKIQGEWQEKQGPARERYPDYAEKVASLEDVFSGIDQSFGDYLAQTVMEMDKGADVLYYLANNPDEAKSIVESGGVKAVIRLGRLESRFLERETPPTPKPKVSSAPTPPPQNKGSAGGRRSVAPDTDDLDAFAAQFFKRK